MWYRFFVLTLVLVLISCGGSRTSSITEGSTHKNSSIDILPAGPSSLTSSVVVSKEALIADGGSTAKITMQLRDLNGNLVTSGSDEITFNQNGNALISEVINHRDGTYTASVKSSEAGTIDIEAFIGDVSIPKVASVSFIPPSQVILVERYKRH